MKNLKLIHKVFIGLISGIIVGALLYPMKENPIVSKYIVSGLFEFLGQGFLRLVKMIIVPLVFASLVTGTSAMNDVKKLGRIGNVEKALLKCSVYEILFKDTPCEIVINEVVELAKVYGDEKTSEFINGVLAKIVNR